MKKQNTINSLVFNKTTVKELNTTQLQQVMGGTGMPNNNPVFPGRGFNLTPYGPSSLNCYVYGNNTLFITVRNNNN